MNNDSAQKVSPLPDVEHLRRLFAYDPIKGVFSGRGQIYKPVVAAALIQGRRARIRVDGIRYSIARIAWKMGYGEDPPGMVRFYDRNPRNLKLVNLVSDKAGKTNDEIYSTWYNMILRCTDPKCDAFTKYGARGIRVCKRWRYSFDLFKEDMGPRPLGYTLHRINNNGDYEPCNCKWATAAEQNAPGAKRFARSNSPMRFIAHKNKPTPWLVTIALHKGSTYCKSFRTLDDAVKHRDFVEYEREVYRLLSIPAP